MNLIILISTLAVVTLLAFFVAVADADNMEFYRGSGYSNFNAFEKLWIVTGGSTVHYNACYDSTLTTAVAVNMCKAMGYPTDNAAFSYFTTPSTMVLARYATCSTISNNLTYMSDCSYSSLSSCPSRRGATLRCGTTGPVKLGASRGVYIGTGGHLMLRQLPNDQLQVRRGFSTSWYNVDMDLASKWPRSSTASAMCYFLGYTQTTGVYWRPTYSNNRQATYYYGLTELYCSSTSPSTLSSCSFYTGRLIRADESENAAGCNCSAPLAPYSSPDPLLSLPMASKDTVAYNSLDTPRIRSLSDYLIIQVPKTDSYGEFTSYSVCRNAIGSTTAKKFCEWAGYGPNAYGYASYTYRDSSLSSTLWSSVNCPSSAKSIDDCTKSTASCSSNYYRVYLYCSSSSPNTPSPSSYSSPDSAGSFPVAAVIVPVIFIFVAVGFSMWARFKARNAFNTAASMNNNRNSSSNNTNFSSTTNSNYNAYAGDFSLNNAEMQSRSSSASPMQPSPFFFTPTNSTAAPANPAPPSFASMPPLPNQQNNGFYVPPPPGAEYGGLPPGFGFSGGYYPPPQQQNHQM